MLTTTVMQNLRVLIVRIQIAAQLMAQAVLQAALTRKDQLLRLPREAMADLHEALIAVLPEVITVVHHPHTQPRQEVNQVAVVRMHLQAVVAEVAADHHPVAEVAADHLQAEAVDADVNGK